MLIRTEDKTRLARMLGWFLQDDVIIERATVSTDAAGNVRNVWRREATVKGRVLPIREKNETKVTGVEAGHEAYRLIAPLASDLQAKDRITVGGVVYEVVAVDTARSDALDVQATVRRAT